VVWRSCICGEAMTNANWHKIQIKHDRAIVSILDRAIKALDKDALHQHMDTTDANLIQEIVGQLKTVQKKYQDDRS
jgi:hypothetical protein